MLPGRASCLRVHGEQVDEALRCVLADAQVEEVVRGQAATAAAAAETTAGGWYAPVAPRFAGAVAEDLGAIEWHAKYVVPMVKIVARCLGNEATVDRAGIGLDGQDFIAPWLHCGRIRPCRALCSGGGSGLPGAADPGHQSASCTARSSPTSRHLAPPDRARFERQVAVLSAGRPVYWISAETRADPAEPRLRLATLLNGTIASQQALARYQSHGAWLEWTAQSPHPRGSAR